MGCGASSSSTSVNNTQNAQAPRAASANQPRPVSSPPRNVPPTVTMPLQNRPLVALSPYPHGAVITQGELNNMRTEFWTSRTHGNAQVWQTIRSAAEGLLEGDLGLANAILEAANLAAPQGTLEVVFDDRGVQYKVPQYCYNIPQELTTQPRPMGGLETVGVSSSQRGGASSTSQDTSAKSGNIASNHGNPPAPPSIPGTPLRLKIRVNPGDFNINVTIDSNCTVLHLKYELVVVAPQAHDALSEITVERQRIIYLGKVLGDNLKLGDAKFDESKIVQVFLRPKTN